MPGTGWRSPASRCRRRRGRSFSPKGGNAVDAAAAMLAAGCTMWDTLSCGGETQALIYDPHTHKVIGIDALGVAPTGATAEFYHSKGYRFPPEYGPLAAVTPGTVGGLLTMEAEYGTLSLKQVLAPAIEMADGYAIEAQICNTIQQYKDTIAQWQYARQVMFTHPGTDHPGAVRGRDVRADGSRRYLAQAGGSGADRRSKPGRRASRPSTRPMTASTRATSPARSCAACARKAACSRWPTSPTGRCTSRSRCTPTTRGSRCTSCPSGSRAR